MRTLPALFVILGCGCASHPAEPAAPPNRVVMTVEQPPAVAIIASAVAPVAASAGDAAPYGGDIHSVRFLASAVVRKQPRSDADKLGIVRRGTRSAVQAAAPAGHGCKVRWIQIAPRGWACESVLAPSSAQPTTASAVSLTAEGDAPAVRGAYGVVRGKGVQAFTSTSDVRTNRSQVLAGSNTVRASGLVIVAGKRYWKTTQGTLIEETSIARISPSKFKGVALSSPRTGSLPAWVRSHSNSREPVKTRSTPGGKVTGTLAPRTIVAILEESGRFVRVAESAWVARADVRVATLAAPPAGTGATEKWFDIDLDQQILVAYEGERPVYATLVSTGKAGHRTPTLITRMMAKHDSAHMISDRDEIYSVADVPWTMYYDGHYALHTSYWHDGFGGPRSHGCINLAPRDAKLLYGWSSPDVPAGWSTVYGDADNPGSLVRVRSSRSSEPSVRGYARTLLERSNLIASHNSRRG